MYGFRELSGIILAMPWSMRLVHCSIAVPSKVIRPRSSTLSSWKILEPWKWQPVSIVPRGRAEVCVNNRKDAQDMSQTNHQPERVITKGSYMKSTFVIIAYPLQIIMTTRKHTE